MAPVVKPVSADSRFVEYLGQVIIPSLMLTEPVYNHQGGLCVLGNLFVQIQLHAIE